MIHLIACAPFLMCPITFLDSSSLPQILELHLWPPWASNYIIFIVGPIINTHLRLINLSPTPVELAFFLMLINLGLELWTLLNSNYRPKIPRFINPCTFTTSKPHDYIAFKSINHRSSTGGPKYQKSQGVWTLS